MPLRREGEKRTNKFAASLLSFSSLLPTFSDEPAAFSPLRAAEGGHAKIADVK
jgi:hypothetical protein